MVNTIYAAFLVAYVHGGHGHTCFCMTFLTDSLKCSMEHEVVQVAWADVASEVLGDDKLVADCVLCVL